MGSTTYNYYTVGHTIASKIDINFQRSEIYDLSKFSLFIKEAFIHRYFSSKLPST